MAFIKATCSCGASFETKGSDIHCGLELSKFLEAHEKCRNKAQSEDSYDLYWKCIKCGYEDNYKSCYVCEQCNSKRT